VNRAYAFLHVKSVDGEKRMISGVASTPEPDRMGDIVEPLGVTYKNPLPLLLYHNSQKPVGQVRFKTPTKDGIEFEATLPTVAEAGTVRDRIEEAWQSIKAGLLAGVSIGFRSIEEAFIKETGSFRFLKTEILELSLVAIPANPDLHSLGEISRSGRVRPSLVRRFGHAPCCTRSKGRVPHDDSGTDHTVRKHPGGEGRAHERADDESCRCRRHARCHRN
jgi:HK97 family phage prohead protease